MVDLLNPLWIRVMPRKAVLNWRKLVILRPSRVRVMLPRVVPMPRRIMVLLLPSRSRAMPSLGVNLPDILMASSMPTASLIRATPRVLAPMQLPTMVPF